MAFLLLSGPYLNHLTRTASAPAMDPAALTLFPSTNLHDNLSVKAGMFSQASSSSTFTADLNLLRGNFDAQADVDAWSMLGVGAKALLGSTGYSGANALTLTLGGGASEVVAIKDVTVRAGEELNWFAAAKDGSSPASVQLRNRQTGLWLNGLTGLWTASTSVYLVQSTDSNWNTGSGHFNVESLSILKRDTTLLRFYLRATDSSTVFDQIELWPSVTWCSVHGHNIPPFVIPTLEYSADGGSWTPQGTMDLVRDSFYEALSSAQRFRYWRILFDGVPDTTSLMYMGEVVLGQHYQIQHNPSYGGSMSWHDRQTRLDGDLGDEFIYLHNQQPQRKVTMSFVFPGLAQYTQFKDEIFRGSRGGGNLICVAPTEYDTTAVVLGRIKEQVDIVKNTPLEWTSNLEVLESPLPNAPEQAYIYDAPVVGGE
jgi:hypothetical protein